MSRFNPNLFLILTIALGFASCAMDKLFLFPDKMESETTERGYVSRLSGDTISVKFDSLRNPSFFTNSAQDVLRYSVDHVAFTSTSGNLLSAWEFIPTSNFNGTTLIFFHGNAGNLVSQHQLVTPFAKRGYKVFMIDYSGFGFSEGSATRDNLLLDGLATVDYVKTRPSLDAENLLIYGQSIGGHLAVAVVEKQEAKIDGLIIEGAFSSHQDIAAKRAWIFGRMAVAQKYSAEKSIKKYTKPILIIHSTEDAAIPYKMGVHLNEKANEPKTFYTIDKCHICGPIYYADSIHAKIQDLIKFKD